MQKSNIFWIVTILTGVALFTGALQQFKTVVSRLPAHIGPWVKRASTDSYSWMQRNPAVTAGLLFTGIGGGLLLYNSVQQKIKSAAIQLKEKIAQHIAGSINRTPIITIPIINIGFYSYNLNAKLEVDIEKLLFQITIDTTRSAIGFKKQYLIVQYSYNLEAKKVDQKIFSKSLYNSIIKGTVLKQFFSDALLAHLNKALNFKFPAVKKNIIYSPSSEKEDSVLQHTSVFKTLVKKSNAFEEDIISFPTTDNRIKNIAKNDTKKQKNIVNHAQGVRVLIHQSVVELINNFLEYKKTYGTAQERTLYQSMNSDAFINRLLIKRPLMFMGSADQYLLRDGKTKGDGGFELIGTKDEKAPLLLQDYLSYDEMQIAALIGVSVPTYFINNGDRDNKGRPYFESKPFEEQGIYVGLVGARFEKANAMEWQHMIVTKDQNTADKGYGISQSTVKPFINLWEAFYGEIFYTYEDVENEKKLEAKETKAPRFINIRDVQTIPEYLDANVYKKRMQMVIEPFLWDANDRAKQQGKKAYCHVVGLGLGVWKINWNQLKLQKEVYEEILREHTFEHISDIDFSYFGNNIDFPFADQSLPETKLKKGEKKTIKIGNNKITMHLSNRNPADKLIGNDAGKLLVAMYAWDGNAYPGNEYWQGSLSASGDPAAACCSTISELQNPLINPYVSHKTLTTYPVKKR